MTQINFGSRNLNFTILQIAVYILAWAGLARGKVYRQNIASHWNFLYFFQHSTVTVQYCCSVSKEKHDQVFSAALLNGRKIQISLQLPDPDLTWRVASMAHWTLPVTLILYFEENSN